MELLLGDHLPGLAEQGSILERRRRERTRPVWERVHVRVDVDLRRDLKLADELAPTRGYAPEDQVVQPRALGCGEPGQHPTEPDAERAHTRAFELVGEPRTRGA